MDSRMRTSEVKIVVLEPDEGNVLTNGVTYSDKVYLGKNDSPDNWREVPAEDINKEPDA